MRILYPTDTRDPTMLNAWERMIAFSQWLKRQPRDENGNTLVITGSENPPWFRT